MSREKQNDELVQMYRDLAEIFDEEYEKRRLITPQNTAEKMTDKGYRKQSEGEWLASDVLRGDEDWKRYACSLCKHMTDAYYKDVRDLSKFCPNCGAKMKGENNE